MTLTASTSTLTDSTNNLAASIIFLTASGITLTASEAKQKKNICLQLVKIEAKMKFQSWKG
jgi:hypothetical protein